MSKAFFRFLRGEINGFYLNQIYNTNNEFTSDIKSFFIAFKKMQFNLATMPTDTIYNIGKFAGVYLPRLSSGEAYGALRLTESHIVDEVERSERGLLRRDTEHFEFEHTEQDSYDTDINLLASSDKRSSIVGDETVRGYIPSTEYDVIDENGDVKPSALRLVPPEDEAYGDYYSNKFMFLAEQTSVTDSIPAPMFIELYKVMQNIRYNGASIVTFIQMIEIICPNNMIRIKSITKDEAVPAFNVIYQYNESAVVTDIQQRLATLEYLTLLKFPQFMLIAEE